LWFTETRVCSAIGRIDLQGKIKEFPLAGTGIGRPSGGIVSAPDGALWFGAGSNIGRITTSGTISVHAIPLKNFIVNALTVGADRAIWFGGYVGDTGASAIGRMTTTGDVRLVAQIPSIPWAITRASDGAIWFTEDYPAAICRLWEDHLQTFRLAEADADPEGVTEGWDGNIWFTEKHSGKIGRIDSKRTIREFMTSGDYDEPIPIARGPLQSVWYGGVTELGRVSSNGTIRGYWPRSPNGELYGVVEGPDGAIWFTEYNIDAIGRIVVH